MDKSVERAIMHMWERYSEPLSLTEIAKIALFSRFYFVRIFRAATGVSPGRFLAAVRIHHAKRLLLNTSMTIAEVAFAVGYNSPGSFANHFTESVGTSPNRFRQLARSGELELPAPGHGVAGAAASPADQARRRSGQAGASPGGTGTLAGELCFPEGQRAARIYVGAFTSAIVQCRPAAATIVDVCADRPTSYLLADVPEGNWFVNAVGVAADGAPWSGSGRSLLVGEPDRIVVAAGAFRRVPVRVRPVRPTDPPVLLALPGLEPLAWTAGAGATRPGAGRAGGTGRRDQAPVTW
jgi:AraC family transcriptional regulator